MGLADTRDAVVTLHRPSNVDNPVELRGLVDILQEARRLTLVFPVHPRTHKRLVEFGLWERITQIPRIRIIDPIGYLDFMSLLFTSSAAITDSGGLQEETTYLGIPCITLRENTERPVTVTHGTNRLMQPADVPTAIDRIIKGEWAVGAKPEFWDGKTAGRVVKSLKEYFQRA